MAESIDSYFIDMIDRSFYYIPRTVVVAVDTPTVYDIRLDAQKIKDFDEGWNRGCINYGEGMDETLVNTAVRIMQVRISESVAGAVLDACFDGREEEARGLAASLYDRAKELYDAAGERNG